MQQIKDKYAALRKEKIEPAEKIISEQREAIKNAHHDDRHCNDDIAKEAVKAVKEKYKHLFANGRPLSNSEEYQNYKKELKEAKQQSITRSIQMIFQDPIASLNPRMTIRNIIAEGLIIRGVKDDEFIDREVKRVLELVGLLPEHANRYPHEFSGGQRQRIGIARAIIMNPELIIADEPVSALDVSIQAQVINLLNDLRNELGLTILFIAHNLSVVKYFCDRIAVMYYGELMEVATSDELFKHPLHPYTKSLLSAVPHPDPNVERGRKRIVYHPEKDHDYSKQGPSLHEVSPGHFVRCNDEELTRYMNEIKDKE
ncbi:MAG: ATP-binding cassette domain-containing protein [Bacilli bacterium]|nr:ATP-binding cassette domain-containing protein [Bacilli bacterium]